MLFSWLKRRRRRRILDQPVDPSWAQHLDDQLEHWSRLPASAQPQLLDISRILLAEKHWEGCAGLTLTEEMRWVIAAQAATLLLGLEHDYYRNVQTILVYPSTYTLPGHSQAGVAGQPDRAVLGHAQMGGPVVLSWRSAHQGGKEADDGRNLVYHEFAHKLDMLDGLVDGTPALGDRQALSRWVKVMSEAYDRLQSNAHRGRRSVLDHYGATNVGEFFACATEAFFEKPRQLTRKEPEVYELLAEFYGQDPSKWQR